MKTKTIVRLIALLSLLSSITHASPLGTAFTYQGRLNDSANPAQGIYDLRFAIYDSATNGSVVAGPLTNAAVAVSNGLLTVALDFGSGVFDGSARWLDIGVRTNGGGDFATLTPRQALTATPYALEATTAASAITAMTAASVPAAGIGSGTANISISGNANTAISAASAGSAATAAMALNAVNLTGPLAGDVTGTQGATTVERIRGVQVSGTAPTTNQLLRFNGTQWIPAAVALGTDVSGTLADAQLSTNVALLNVDQTFTGSNTFSGVVTATNPANMFGGSFTGNGAGLTNLNASLLASGTLPNARLSGIYSSAITLNSVNASGSFSGSFNGSGSGLTSLNANNLTSGTVPDGRLSGTYSSPVMFNNPVNSFNGNGSGLTSLNANNLMSGAVPDGRLSGTYSSPVMFNNGGGNSFSGNGANLTGLNANNLASGTVPDVRLSSNVPLLNGNPTFSTPVTMGSFLSLAQTVIVPLNGGTITPTSSYVLLNPGAAVVLGGIAIANGTRVGDVLVLQVSTGNPFTVTVPNNANTKLSAVNHVLAANDTLVLIWGGGGTGWVELAYANN